MKQIILFLVFCLTATGLSAQKANLGEMDLQRDGRWYKENTIEPFSGAVEDRWMIKDPENPKAKPKVGPKKSRIEIKDGLQHGKTTQWYRTGDKRSVSIFENGKKNGEEIQYYPNGSKKLSINYVDGIPTGIMQEWHQNEAKKSEGLYQKGLEEGEHTWWYKSGKIDQKVTYKNGSANGLVQHWYEKGQQKLKAQYTAGLRDGKVEEWYESGQLKTSGNYLNGKENGDISFYSSKGLLLEIRTYKMGALTQVQDFRSGAIKTGLASFLQVFNEKESFFLVEIQGQDFVRDRSGYDITYNVDGMLLQMLSKPTAKGITDNSLSTDKEKLLHFMQNEKKFIEQNTVKKIQVESKIASTKTGMTYLHWWFDSPVQVDATSKRNIKREHYLSVICNKQILSLYSLVTARDNETAITSMLKNTAERIKLKTNRIDLNKVKKEYLK